MYKQWSVELNPDLKLMQKQTESSLQPNGEKTSPISVILVSSGSRGNKLLFRYPFQRVSENTSSATSKQRSPYVLNTSSDSVEDQDGDSRYYAKTGVKGLLFLESFFTTMNVVDVNDTRIVFSVHSVVVSIFFFFFACSNPCWHDVKRSRVSPLVHYCAVCFCFGQFLIVVWMLCWVICVCSEEWIT